MLRRDPIRAERVEKCCDVARLPLVDSHGWHRRLGVDRGRIHQPRYEIARDVGHDAGQYRPLSELFQFGPDDASCRPNVLDGVARAAIIGENQPSPVFLVTARHPKVVRYARVRAARCQEGQRNERRSNSPVAVPSDGSNSLSQCPSPDTRHVRAFAPSSQQRARNLVPRASSRRHAPGGAAKTEQLSSVRRGCLMKSTTPDLSIVRRDANAP